MKTIILTFLFFMTLLSCDDSIFRSRKYANRRQYPPEKMFSGDALHAAQKMFDGDIKGMEKEIKQRNIDLNQLNEEKGYTLLMYATIIEDLEAMERLMQLGADPNIIVPYVGFKTPLRFGVATNNYKMMDLLFKYKANPNPKLGDSPLVVAMTIAGFEGTDKKMVDYLLSKGANINNLTLNGDNIMEAGTMNSVDMAFYFLEKGGKPVIEGTNLCPMAGYIQYKENDHIKFPREDKTYINKLLKLKNTLIEKYNVKFPYVKDTIEEARLRVRLYEQLSPQDKKSINFNKNYGENLYQKDLKRIQGK